MPGTPLTYSENFHLKDLLLDNGESLSSPDRPFAPSRGRLLGVAFTLPNHLIPAKPSPCEGPVFFFEAACVNPLRRHESYG